MASLLLSAKTSYATRKGTIAGARPYKDIYGTSYKKPENLFRDKDKNGVRNLYQKRDRQKSRKNKCRR